MVVSRWSYLKIQAEVNKLTRLGIQEWGPYDIKAPWSFLTCLEDLVGGTPR